MTDNGISYHAKFDTKISEGSVDNRGYSTDRSRKEHSNWWMSDEVSMPTCEQDINNVEHMSTSEHSEYIKSSDEELMMDFKDGEWTPGNAMEKC